MVPTEILGNLDLTSALSSSVLVLFYMVFFAMMGALGYVGYLYLIKYNQRVIIFQALNNTWTIHTDRACMTKKKNDYGHSFLYLMKQKKELPPVSRKEYGLIRTLFGRNDCLMFYTVDDFKNLLPVRFSSVSETRILEVLDEWNASMLHLNEHKRQEQKFVEVSVWNKYAPFVLPIITLVICFVMVIITLKYVNDMSGTANGVASSLKEALVAYKSGPVPTS